MRHVHYDLLGFMAPAALVALALSTAAAAEAPSVPKALAAHTIADAVTLRALPATHEELVFRGESATRSWPVYFTRDDAAQVTQFRLGLLNTVSVLPESSSLKVAINGVMVGEVPVASAQATSIVVLNIPNGLLVPGFNVVTVSTALTHRVDCSVKATHELWALLKPNETGFVMPPRASSLVSSIQDLAGLKLAEDGTVRLHLRMSGDPKPADVDRAGRFIAALVTRLHWMRPIVDVGPGAGTGPGLDVVIGRTADLQVSGVMAQGSVTRVDGLAIGRDASTSRPMLTLSAGTDAELDTALRTFVKASAEAKAPGTMAGLRLLDQAAGPRVDSGQRLSLDDLGLGTLAVVGRRFVGTMHVTMPGDVFPGGFAHASLILNGTHSADLDPSAAMTIRVNGTVASFSTLATGLPTTFKHHRIDLPLNLFHAGANEVEIEAVTPSRLDKVCDTTQMSNAVRFSLSGTSTMEFPSLAHLRVTPELAGTTETPEVARSVYLPDATRPSIGSGLTLAAMLAASGGQRQVANETAFTFHLAPPLATDDPGIVVAPFERLPPALAAPLSHIANTATEQLFDFDDAVMTKLLKTDTPAPQPATEARWRQISAQWTEAAWTSLQRWHFYFGGADTNPPLLPVTTETLIVAALDPDAGSTSIAGLELPSFRLRPTQWLVITGDSALITHAGIERLAIDERLPRLAGQALSLALDTGETHIRRAADRTYVMPKSLALTEIRPILGGFMSDNISLAALVLLSLLALLGGSTHLLIRRLGER